VAGRRLPSRHLQIHPRYEEVGTNDRNTQRAWRRRHALYRPTYLTWLPDSTMFVADGYVGTRVAKFDKDGKFLMDWGQKGTPRTTRGQATSTACTV